MSVQESKMGQWLNANRANANPSVCETMWAEAMADNDREFGYTPIVSDDFVFEFESPETIESVDESEFVMGQTFSESGHIRYTQI